MKIKKHQLLLGAHMSTAGGYEKAIERGESIGCTTIQIFTKSNRQWKAKPITDQEAATFKSTLKNSSIRSVVVHAAYLINLASTDKRVFEQSIHALIQELERCQILGIPHLILHPGSFGSGAFQDGAQQVAQGLDSALEHTQSNTMILLENMAGQGSSVGATFEQLALIRSMTASKKRIAFAFDTCHAFAAGYNFTTNETYETMWKDFDKILGLENLKAIHINDSKKECGSKVDRHEDVGEGKIGLEGFQLLFNDERFFDIPKILETPRAELEDYARNMKVIGKLFSEETNRKLGIE